MKPFGSLRTALLLFSFVSLHAFGQDTPYYHGVRRAPQAVTAPGFTESTGTSGTGANIDVLYHKIYWRINPDSTVKYIRGSVQTNFKTIQPNVQTVSFDLRSVLAVDSVRFRNALLPSGNIVRTGNIVTIDLSVVLPSGFIDSLTIYYQGVPPAVSGAAQGYQRSSNAGAGNFITTLSESYEDRDWWPCKADMQDKIDSMDIEVSVPWAATSEADTFWVACNGKLVDSTINGTNRNFLFKTRYPIASYLVFVSVAKYTRYHRTVDVNGTAVPVVYNLFKGKTAATYTNILTAMDKINPLLTALGPAYSPYPFKNEKHGFYDGLLGAGGMEHQTMSGIATSALQSVSTLAHELAHQWFGDNVTFATWNDLWLAEGFARYTESFAGEMSPGTGLNPYTIRNNFKNGATANITHSAWIPNAFATTSDLIWNTPYGGVVYERGAMIVSMLRTICGTPKFFEALNNYQTALSGKTATTDSLKNHFNRVLGRDLTPFFNDYVGGSGPGTTAVGGIGHPTNTVNWNSPAPNKLVVQMGNQTRTSGSNVSYFRGPIVLHVKGSIAAQDTTIVFFDWGSGNLSHAGNGVSLPIPGNRLTYYLSFTPVTVAYDDSARTLSQGSAVNVPGLDGYTWYGNTDFSWNNTSNWSAATVPPAGADITIATVGSNQPVLPGAMTVGPLTILGSNSIMLNNQTLTLNSIVRGTGTFTGSSLSGIIVADSCGVLNFDQATLSNRSLQSLTLNPGTQATIGTGPLEIFGPLNLPPRSKLTVNSNNLIVH